MNPIVKDAPDKTANEIELALDFIYRAEIREIINGLAHLSPRLTKAVLSAQNDELLARIDRVTYHLQRDACRGTRDLLDAVDDARAVADLLEQMIIVQAARRNVAG